MTAPDCIEEFKIDSSESAGLRYNRLRAPANDGEALVVPPFACVGRILADNETNLATASCKIFGMPLPELAQQARKEVLSAAVAYTGSYRPVSASPEQSGRVIAAGHQPELFHPGVWYKNFALADLARAHQATAINLVIDTDDAKTTNISVPSGSVDRPIVRHLPLDDPSESLVPFEERTIINPDRLAAFGDLAAECLAPLVGNPLIKELWPLVIERARQTNNLGAALSQSRHLLEEQLGLNSLELPQSQVCETSSFRRFVAHLLCKAAEFVSAHNEALELYRQINRVRSQAHPVANLQIDNGWIETPFWVWSAEQPIRRSLFVKPGASEVILSDRDNFQARIPMSCGSDHNAEAVIQALADLSERGVKLRTKALATTMWARLALSNLFLHGIGGAKYDQLNDEIIRRFFEYEPPGFLTVSATLRLPISNVEQLADESSIAALEQQMRELEFKPERHIGQAERERTDVQQLLAEKRGLAQQTVARGPESRSRFHRFRQINAQLHQFIAAKRIRVEQLLNEARIEARAQALLRSREFSFCLFPLDNIRGFLLAIRPNEP